MCLLFHSSVKIFCLYIEFNINKRIIYKVYDENSYKIIIIMHYEVYRINKIEFNRNVEFLKWEAMHACNLI